MQSESKYRYFNGEETIEIRGGEPMMNSPNVSLVQTIQIDEKQQSCCSKFSQWLFPRIQYVQRKIVNPGIVYPRIYLNNKIDNSKYNFITFLPLVFFNQFKYFLNLYFLVIALMQFIPILQVGLIIRSRRELRFTHYYYSSNFNFQRIGG